MKVTNITKTSRVLYDKGGKRFELAPGESADLACPPENHYAFKVHTEKKEKNKEEPKVIRRNE